jgi:hypothetical protein
VVTADEPVALSRRIGHHRRAPVAAGVVERVDRAAIGMNDDHRLPGGLPQAEAPGLGDLVDVAGQQPGLAPDVLLLQIVEALIRVAPSWKVRQVREPVGRRIAADLVLHQLPERADFLLVHRIDSSTVQSDWIRVPRDTSL